MSRASCRIRFCFEKSTHNVSYKDDKYVPMEGNRPDLCKSHAESSCNFRNLPNDSYEKANLAKELFFEDFEEKLVNYPS